VSANDKTVNAEYCSTCSQS